MRWMSSKRKIPSKKKSSRSMKRRWREQQRGLLLEKKAQSRSVSSISIMMSHQQRKSPNLQVHHTYLLQLRALAQTWAIPRDLLETYRWILQTNKKCQMSLLITRNKPNIGKQSVPNKVNNLWSTKNWLFSTSINIRVRIVNFWSFKWTTQKSNSSSICSVLKKNH